MIKNIRIGEKGIGAGEPTFIIAEIGSNHDGRLDQAKQLIDAAVRIGADAVKFQSFRADRLVTPQQEAFGLPVGSSDHTLGIAVPLGAVALGACLLEKHFTLDRTLTGPDHPHSMEVEEFEEMIREIRCLEAALGTGVKAPVEAELPEREHVTSYIWKNPRLFRLGTIDPEEDLSGMRWTVDDERDLRLVTEIFRGLYRQGEIFGMADILKFLRENPALLEINRGTIRNEGYLKSLREEGDL